jgi:aconitate hydratase
MKPGNNSFNTLSTLDVDGQEYYYFSLDKLAAQNLSAIHRLPFSLKILLENILRFERGEDDATGDIQAFAQWVEKRSSDREIAFRPTRVLMQDLTGVPAVVDLAAMRDAASANPQGINPQIPVDLILSFGHGR